MSERLPDKHDVKVTRAMMDAGLAEFHGRHGSMLDTMAMIYRAMHALAPVSSTRTLADEDVEPTIEGMKEAFILLGYWPNEILWKVWKEACLWRAQYARSAIVPDDMVAVKRSDLSMWAAWFEECAAHDMQAEYEDGSKTPNAGTFECFAKDMRALLGTSDDTAEKP